MFKDDVYVDPSSVLDGRPNYANITFSELFARLCVDQPKVMNEGPDYVIALFSEFCAGVTPQIPLGKPLHTNNHLHHESTNEIHK